MEIGPSGTQLSFQENVFGNAVSELSGFFSILTVLTHFPHGLSICRHVRLNRIKQRLVCWVSCIKKDSPNSRIPWSTRHPFRMFFKIRVCVWNDSNINSVGLYDTFDLTYVDFSGVFSHFRIQIPIHISVTFFLFITVVLEVKLSHPTHTSNVSHFAGDNEKLLLIWALSYIVFFCWLNRRLI